MKQSQFFGGKENHGIANFVEIPGDFDLVTLSQSQYQFLSALSLEFRVFETMPIEKPGFFLNADNLNS